LLILFNENISEFRITAGNLFSKFPKKLKNFLIYGKLMKSNKGITYVYTSGGT